MGVPKEVGLKVEDFMGVNRQQTDEDLPDGYFTTAQNLYERKIGELQRRGGSTQRNLATQPSNISAMYSNYVLYDKVLGKTNLLKIGCTNQKTGFGNSLTLAGVSAAFVTDVPNGRWGVSPVGLVASNGFAGCKSIALVATGFGINCLINTELTAGLPIAGDTKRLDVTIAAPLGNRNITGIEVYAKVNVGWTGGVGIGNYIYVGHIDLVATPSGTFSFNYGPLHMATDPGATVQDVGGTDTSWTVSQASGGGSFVPGKTYFVAVLDHQVYWNSSDPFATRNRWVTRSIKSITIAPGNNNISITKTSGGSSATLIAVGLHPQTLRPMPSILTSAATFTATLTTLPNETMWGCCGFVPRSTTINDGLYIFSASDVSNTEMFCKIDSNGNWIPLPINNYYGMNSDVPAYTGTDTAPSPFEPAWNAFASGGRPTVSSASDYSSVQYVSQDQELLYLAPMGTLTGVGRGPKIITGDLTLGSAVVLNVSSMTDIAADQGVIGPGIPEDTQVTIPDVLNSKFTMDKTATVTQAGATLEVMTGGGYEYCPSHALVQCDGKTVCMAVMDFGCASPPPFTVISVYKEHLTGTGGSGIARNKLYFANAFSPYNWGVPGLTATPQYVQIASTGEDVIALTEYTNTQNLTGPIQQLTIGKRSSLWILTDFPGYTSSSYNTGQVVQLSKKAGCANARSIIYTELGTIVVGIDNVWLIRGTGEPTPLGDEIKYFLRSEDPNQTVDPTYWSAVYHGNYVKIAFSLPGSSTPNQELWLDINKTKKMEGKPVWWGPMVGRETWQSTVEEQFNDTIIPKRLSVDRTNLRWFQADKEDVLDDFGTQMTCTLSGKVYGMQDDMTNKLYMEQFWKLKVDQSLAFTETMTALNDSGVITDSNSRTCPIVAGYVSSDYAHFVSSCRAKLYRFFPANRGLRGENLKVQWSYTGTILFAIAGMGLFYMPERRRPGT